MQSREILRARAPRGGFLLQPGARSSASGRAPGSGNELKVEAPPCHFKRSVVLLLEPHVSFFWGGIFGILLHGPSQFYLHL